MCAQNAFVLFWTILNSFYHLRTGSLSTDSIDCDGMGWIGPLFPTSQDQKKTFKLNMELELERELIAFSEMRFDFQVASLCLCISYEMLFILFYLFISLGAS